MQDPAAPSEAHLWGAGALEACCLVSTASHHHGTPAVCSVANKRGVLDVHHSSCADSRGGINHRIAVYADGPSGPPPCMTSIET